MLTLDVVSRLIGLHQLIIFNFYPYIQRFLQPHQKGYLFIYLFKQFLIKYIHISFNLFAWLCKTIFYLF